MCAPDMFERSKTPEPEKPISLSNSYELTSSRTALVHEDMTTIQR